MQKNILTIFIITFSIILFFSVLAESNSEFIDFLIQTIWKDCEGTRDNNGNLLTQEGLREIIIRNEQNPYRDNRIILGGPIPLNYPLLFYCEKDGERKELHYYQGDYYWKGEKINIPSHITYVTTTEEHNFIKFELSASLMSLSPFSINLFPITIIILSIFIPFIKFRKTIKNWILLKYHKSIK